MRRRCLVAMLVLACGACASPERRGSIDTYVGAVAGTDARVGIVAKDDVVIGYSCGGAITLEDLTTWVSGPRNGQSFELVRGAGTISGTISPGGEIDGLLDIDGEEHVFSATLVEPGSVHGLYGAGLDDPSCLTGVVVLPGAGGSSLVQGASTCGALEQPFNQVTPTAVPADDEGFDVVVTGWASDPIRVRPVDVAPRY